MLGFDFKNYTEATPPPINTFQVALAQEVSFHQKEATGTRWLKIVGAWVEYGNKRFYKSIFFPRTEGNEQEINKDINKFLRTMAAFGLGADDLHSEMSEYELAELLEGRYAVGKVGEDRNGYLTPTYFKALSEQQARKYHKREESNQEQPKAVSFGRSFKG